MAKIADSIEAPESFSTETPAAEAPKAPRVVNIGGQAVGRRKQAIARVRIIPGSGQWKINGRTLEEYFQIGRAHV